MTEQNPEQAHQVTEQAPAQSISVDQTGGDSAQGENVEISTPNTDIQIDSTPDPQADATQDDDKAEQTDNSTTPEDGDQTNVPQTPIQESQVQAEGNNDGESAS